MNASTRFAIPMAALILLAALPVLVHKYQRPKDDSCAGWPELLAHYEASGAPGMLNGDSVYNPTKARSFLRVASDDGTFVLSGLAPGSGAKVGAYAVVRSFDPKRIYHRPAISLIPGVRANERLVEHIEHDGESLPIHRVRFDSSDEKLEILAGYILTYGDSLVANPYLAQLRAAPRMLFTGRAPMGLFFFWALVTPDQREPAERALHAWLADAWDRYRAICHP